MKETKVSDLPLAGYLCARDYPLVRVEGTNGRKLFVFAGVPESAILDFYNGQGTVSARRLLDALRNLKGLTLQAL